MVLGRRLPLGSALETKRTAGKRKRNFKAHIKKKKATRTRRAKHGQHCDKRVITNVSTVNSSISSARHTSDFLARHFKAQIKLVPRTGHGMVV